MENNLFKVVIIGRPNVGKSTLFNFLSGRNLALTSAVAGLTRDRKENTAELYDIKFNLVDTGGYDVQEKGINTLIWQQSQEAIKQADVILFVLDGNAGLSPIDTYLANLLRIEAKPTILVVNKVDTRESKKHLSTFHELGFNDICYVSAVHGLGMRDLYDILKKHYKAYQKIHSKLDTNIAKPDLMLSFVGKPNVGKSTLINTLLQEDRLVASNIAGTTRDSIYLDLHYNNQFIKLVDTAGLRRRSKVHIGIEKLANSDSMKAINFSTVVALVISAEDGLTKQDLTLAQHIVKEGRGLIIVINKIDLIKNKKAFINEVTKTIEDNFFQIKEPYIIGISALKDKDINIILNTALELYTKWQFTISTAKLNVWLRDTIATKQPPSIKGKRLKIKYATQTKERPPTISLWSNFAKEFPQSYLRYLQNEFYKTFNLWGCTLRFVVKKSDNPYAQTNKRKPK